MPDIRYSAPRFKPTKEKPMNVRILLLAWIEPKIKADKTRNTTNRYFLDTPSFKPINKIAFSNKPLYRISYMRGAEITVSKSCGTNILGWSVICLSSNC